MTGRLAAALLAVCLAGAAAAGTLELRGDFTQGGLVEGRTEAGAEVTLDGRPVRVALDGRFVFGFGRDHPPSAKLVVRYRDGTGERRALKIAARRYQGVLRCNPRSRE